MTDEKPQDWKWWKDEAYKAAARAEAAEQSRAKFMGQLRVMSGLAEAAQERAEAAESLVKVERRERAEGLVYWRTRAEAAEERAHYANGVADTNINRANEAEARAEAAEKREAVLINELAECCAKLMAALETKP